MPTTDLRERLAILKALRELHATTHSDKHVSQALPPTAAKSFVQLDYHLVFADLLAGLQSGSVGVEYFRVKRGGPETNLGDELFLSSRVLGPLRQMNPGRYGGANRYDLKCSLRLSVNWRPGHNMRMGLRRLRKTEKVWKFSVTQTGALLEICKLVPA